MPTEISLFYISVPRLKVTSNKSIVAGKMWPEEKTVDKWTNVLVMILKQLTALKRVHHDGEKCVESQIIG